MNVVSKFTRVVTTLFTLSVIIAVSCFFQGCREPDRSPVSFSLKDSSLFLAHRNIRLRLDNRMYMKVDFFDGQDTITIHDFPETGISNTPVHFIELNGVVYSDFKLISYRVEDINGPWFGSGKRLIISGRDRNILKTMFIEMYDDMPDVAVTWCRYTNMSDSVLFVDNVYYDCFPLNRSLSNDREKPSSFHYLQPLNRDWGETWTNLAVTDSTHETFRIPEDGSNHSGVPFLDVWGAEMGISIFHVEGIQRYLNVILNVKENGKLFIGFNTKPGSTHGQFPSQIIPGASVTTWKSAVCVHKGDFFNGARRFGQMLDAALRSEGKKGLIRDYPDYVYAPYWKTWGMNSLDGTREFSLQQVRDRLNSLADFGFGGIMLDAGWNKDRGLWTLDPGKFESEKTMMKFVRDLHEPKWGSDGNKDFRVYLWFDLLGVDTACSVTRPMLVKNQDGSIYPSIQSPYALCPAYAGTISYIRDSLIRKIVGRWGVDGLYTDLEDQNPLPCFDSTHHHRYPAENMEYNFRAFREMHAQILNLKPGSGWTSQCACAAVHDVYQYPWYFFEDASDPVTNEQVRWRVRWIKAVRGPTAPAGDGYVDKMNYDRKAGEPAQSVAIGSVITSVRWETGELGGADHARKWMELYEREALSSGEYLGLYDIAYEKPEGYVIRKEDGSVYYGFFAAEPFARQIELRGLKPDIRYRMTDYETDKDLGEISGSNPAVRMVSKNGNNQGERVHYAVLKCTPVVEQ